ncbi:hypothetical protein [Sinorhizobium americanum]|uniref:Uncharacterized protein n=1 Tax=Sinorhizobium americanum TaxID=194963 RepID=A0A4R2BWI0_9HYPH|nr:hypothetical protein [Sinorhizobium americanum]TCN31302.1 hypothetical protein EV184_10674 [Sinorhizobium americanum]
MINFRGWYGSCQKQEPLPGTMLGDSYKHVDSFNVGLVIEQFSRLEENLEEHSGTIRVPLREIQEEPECPGRIPAFDGFSERIRGRTLESGSAWQAFVQGGILIADWRSRPSLPAQVASA